ncbi:uncharacterized protein [Hoplias malabaricus]|uniref:uncharacterized protein n=1 Tax=Hoplias malabaricus TaxID=27720 RepID=UPI00346353D4
MSHQDLNHSQSRVKLIRSIFEPQNISQNPPVLSRARGVTEHKTQPWASSPRPFAMKHRNISADQRFENEKNSTEIDVLRAQNVLLASQNRNLTTQLQDNQDHLKNFKERMGKVVDLKLGSSGIFSEDLTNPCRESELINMYEKLRKNHWASLLRQLKSRGVSPDLRNQVEKQVKDVLNKAERDMKTSTAKLKELFRLNNEHCTNTMTSLFFNLAVQNLQKAIFYQNKEPFQVTDMGIPDVLSQFLRECDRIVCLLVLHNPPLSLDWEEIGRGVFPPLKTVSGVAADNVFVD